MLLFTDSFDSMAAIGDAVVKGWSIANQGAGSWTFLSTGGVNGGGALDCAQDDIPAIRAIRPAAAGIDHIRFAGWFKSGGNPGATDHLVKFFDSVAATFMHFSITTAGEILVQHSNTALNGSSTLGTTTGAALHDTNYHFIELYFLSDHDADGRVKVKVDNVTLLDVAGSNAQSASATQRLLNLEGFYIYGPDTNGVWDDIIVWDDVAGDGFTGELTAPLIIGVTRPDAAGDSTGLTPNTGTNYQAVDESGLHDGDTTYVSGNTNGLKDLYNFSAISPTPVSIKAVSVNMVVKTEAGAEVGVKAVAKNGGVEGSSTTLNFSNPGYKTQQRFLSQDPSTAAAWTEAGLNSTQFGPELVI